MDETPRLTPGFVRAVALGAAGGIGKRVAEQAAEYEQLLIFADQCNVSRAAVDAKLLTASVKGTFDWIASGEAVPLPPVRGGSMKTFEENWPAARKAIAATMSTAAEAKAAAEQALAALRAQQQSA